MSKNSIKRRKLQLARNANFLDFFHLMPDEINSNSSPLTFERNKNIFAILQKSPDVIVIKAAQVVEHIEETVKNGDEVRQKLDEISKQSALRPPFGTILFEFKHPEYQHYGALCTNIESKLFILGLRVRNRKFSTDIITDGSSSVIDLDDDYRFKDYTLYTPFDMPRREDDNDPLLTMAEVVFTLALLNCRNITLIDNEPDSEISNQYQQHFGQPLVKFKTLAIKPIGKRYVSDIPKDYQGLMPLHLRRGNFATYTDDKPLFGKFTGTFWRPATAVGENKNGVVIKDYEVQP